MRLDFGKRLGELWITRLSAKLRTLVLLPLLAILLSGCVDYDVGIQFKSPSAGEIVQHIQIGERLRSFSDTTVRQALATIEQQARRVGGRVERQRDQTLSIRIPFSDAADLTKKFNQFYSPPPAARQPKSQSAFSLPQFESQLSVTRNNLLLFERNRLRYDVDLRSLGVAANGSVVLSPTALVNLEFAIAAPWGASSTTPRGEAGLPAQKVGNRLVWQLVPGQVNHLEAVFWMPNPLGIGTLLIGLLVWVGSVLKRASKPLDPPTAVP